MSNPDTPLDAPITALSSIERGRLARVIHDDVMQSLAACVLAADLSDRYCREGRLDDARLELGAIREGMDLAITALRDLLIDLRVPA